jgi:Tfp pilus assembly protein PilO
MTTRPTLLITVVVLLAALVAGMAGMAGYQAVATAMQARRATEQQATLARLQRQADTVRKARAARLPLGTRVIAQPASWTWSEQLPPMMKQLSVMAEGSGVTLDTMQPAPVITHGALARFPLRVTLHASLSAITAFLKRAQEATPVLAVDQLTIRPGQTPGEPLAVEMTLSAYIRTDGRAATGGRP